MIDDHFDDLAQWTCKRRACQLLGRPRATHYRRQAGPVYGPPSPRPIPANALTDDERAKVLALLHSPTYRDFAPAQVWAMLLDAGEYLCSIRTMYRLLEEAGENRERRRQRSHPARKRPELLATAPNQVWSWDITKLRGPERGVYYDLYVIIDIYSRYVVGWTVAANESGELAAELIGDAIATQGIARDQLSLHADRGTSMTSKPVAQLLVDLGVARSHSRPHVSNDNPYSEAGFKTFKYRPDFPRWFDSLEHAVAHGDKFFAWYNFEHHHWGLALCTPAQVHHGQVDTVIAHRQHVLDTAYTAHPERFVRRPPIAKRPPDEAWINRPTEEDPSTH